MSLAEVLADIREWPPALTYGALLFGAFVEYVFPPFPGDTVVVAGAVLVAAFDWSPWPVLALVTGGAVAGGLVDWQIGRWLHASGRLERLRPAWRDAIHGIAGQFERRGAWYLAVNRFVPGIRAFFFVAAGVAGLGAGRVAFWCAVSAVLWNALLLAVGFAVGDNVEELDALVGRYTIVVWAVVGVVLAVVIARFVLKRRRARET
ncbi:MAG: VTT domain-containing protein [Myxococcales bacterium]|nr:VTT domain-containing protein [Myxococcales bacterium]MCB9732302.1 VTT domain-containing protein [Deltaproteobacteria bacterium]